jgi:hypothetical protein
MLADGGVEYDDGTPSNSSQQAKVREGRQAGRQAWEGCMLSWLGGGCGKCIEASIEGIVTCFTGTWALFILALCSHPYQVILDRST